MAGLAGHAVGVRAAVHLGLGVHDRDREEIPDLITGFQLLAAAASLGTIAIVGRLARRVRPERAVFAVAAIGLNPIVVFHVVGGGHNDMLVAFFIAAAAALLFAERELLSAVALALGMSVKATAAVPLILLIVAVAANTPPERRARVLRRSPASSAACGCCWRSRTSRRTRRSV